MENSKPVSILNLIAVPAIITLGVTILRLEGELHHWSMTFFNRSAGGGGALIGISWLPIIFGPYFALKLAGSGAGPSSLGKATKFMLLGLLVFIVGGVGEGLSVGKLHNFRLALVAFIVMLIAAIIPRAGWRSLGNTLLAYAFAARIPVLVVMYFAMSANGGLGWGTHYDAAEPPFTHLPLGVKFFDLAVVPQMTFWIGYTVVLGAIFGIILTALFRRSRQTLASSQ
jgi:hypothetical protein